MFFVHDFHFLTRKLIEMKERKIRKESRVVVNVKFSSNYQRKIDISRWKFATWIVASPSIHNPNWIIRHISSTRSHTMKLFGFVLISKNALNIHRIYIRGQNIFSIYHWKGNMWHCHKEVHVLCDSLAEFFQETD